MAKRELTWSKADVQTLRDLAAHNASIEDIAERLNRSPNAIRLAAKRYKVTIYQVGRKWTDSDRDYLRRYYGRQPLWYIERALHRSPNALAQMAHKMRLDAVYRQSENIPINDFVEATGITRERILRTLVPKYGFPILKCKTGLKQQFYFVDFDQVLDWMEAHQDLYDGSKIKDDFFFEPDWLRAKKQRDRDDNTYLDYNVRRSAWTEREVSTLRFLAKEGWTPTQIATRIDRSPRAIAAKMWTIKA